MYHVVRENGLRGCELQSKQYLFVADSMPDIFQRNFSVRNFPSRVRGVQEIERESEQRLLVDRERKRQALGQEERLQAVEAAACASIDTPPGTPGVVEAGKSPGGGRAGAAVAVSEQERVAVAARAAAARAAAQRYDPSQPQGAAGAGGEVDVDGNDVVRSLPCSCLIRMCDTRGRSRASAASTGPIAFECTCVHPVRAGYVFAFVAHLMVSTSFSTSMGSPEAARARGNTRTLRFGPYFCRVSMILRT